MVVPNLFLHYHGVIGVAYMYDHHNCLMTRKGKRQLKLPIQDVRICLRICIFFLPEPSESSQLCEHQGYHHFKMKIFTLGALMLCAVVNGVAVVSSPSGLRDDQ